MATIKKKAGKRGTVYHFRTYDGYDSRGKQIEKTMTWKPPTGMTERQADKEAVRQAALFEESIRNGNTFDKDTRFGEYSEKWLRNMRSEVAPKTFERYESLLKVINQALGEIRLCKLQPHHLQEFYENLREKRVKQTGSYAVSDKLCSIMKEHGLSQQKLAEMSNVSKTTINAACKPEGRISIESAQKIAAALKMPETAVFEMHVEKKGLSPKTILHHHRLISTILNQAVREQLIPYNAAARMKAPKQERKEAAFLDEEQAKRVLELLDKEPIKWRTALYLLMFSGMRRGELLGLEWKDIDFDNQVIHVRDTSQYVSGRGIITKCTKNETSTRTIKLSENIFTILKEYRDYWMKLREDMGDRWQDRILITLADGSQQLIRNDRLFIKEDSTPMHPDSLTEWTRKFVKRNDLPHFSPHSLRHTHATLLINEGVNIPAVSRRLGHSSISTTTKIYIHAIQEADEIASEAIDSRLNSLRNNKKDEES